jgi:salicylate hydroxylase
MWPFVGGGLAGLALATATDAVQWNHKLVQMETTTTLGDDDKNQVELTFDVATGDTGETRVVKTPADLVVGADGILSQVRRLLLGEKLAPLRYLDCLVVLGICPIAGIADSALLDGETVFQTADGTTRIYMMPYSDTEYMWQLSFPMSEQEALQTSEAGEAGLRQEALRRCQSWHAPIPQILEATPSHLISGYPVYDSAVLTSSDLSSHPRVPLVGDACHPMSPFKGQGANQAMLDALDLAHALYATPTNTTSPSDSLADFETKMLQRAAPKVQASADAARFLHSEVAVQEGNVTRGAAASKSMPDNNPV